MNFHEFFVAPDDASSNSMRKAWENKLFICKMYAKYFMFFIFSGKNAVIENRSKLCWKESCGNRKSILITFKRFNLSVIEHELKIIKFLKIYCWFVCALDVWKKSFFRVKHYWRMQNSWKFRLRKKLISYIWIIYIVAGWISHSF